MPARHYLTCCRTTEAMSAATYVVSPSTWNSTPRNLRRALQSVVLRDRYTCQHCLPMFFVDLWKARQHAEAEQVGSL